MLARRDFLKGLSAAAINATCSACGAAADPVQRKHALGLVLYCCRIRRDSLRDTNDFDLFDPFHFLEHCQQLGAGGMQVALGIRDLSEARRLRRLAESRQLYLEAIATPPFQESERDRFIAEMQTAKEAGAAAVRTVIIPGRRYEYFQSLQQFREADARGRAALERAAPIADRLRLPLAVENHKDHRDAERVEMFEAISSEYVGACLDTGNSFALLEDPLETARRLAPWTHAVHLKDQALQPYEDGFLLADIPLGDGAFDLPAIVALIQEKKPSMRFTLELITRDPLKVPVLTEQYWATFPDIPAKDLARALRTVSRHAAPSLPTVSTLDARQQLALEDNQVRASLEYAQRVLGL